MDSLISQSAHPHICVGPYILLVSKIHIVKLQSDSPCTYFSLLIWLCFFLNCTRFHERTFFPLLLVSELFWLRLSFSVFGSYELHISKLRVGFCAQTLNCANSIIQQLFSLYSGNSSCCNNLQFPLYCSVNQHVAFNDLLLYFLLLPILTTDSVGISVIIS